MSKQVLFDTILDYVAKNADCPPSLKKLAEEFSITPQYLCRIFQKNLGMTYHKYLHSGSLRERSNISYQHTISPTATSYFPSSWNTLLNLGYAAQLEGQHIARQLQIAQSILHFKFGRICQIIELIRIEYRKDQTAFDYSNVFNILDLVLDNNLRPYLELGYKTFYIHTTSKWAFSQNEESVSEHFKKTIELLPGLIKACMNRYGQKEVNQWYFEISYPYILPGSSIDMTLYQFIFYYEKIYDILKKYLPSCKIGGPGFNGWESSNMLETTLSHLSDSRCTPDFFSAYLYLMHKDEEISSDVDLFHKRINKLDGSVHQTFPHAEIWISEFNSNLSTRNYLNDSTYQGVFLLKSISDVACSKINALGYYLLADLPLRSSDTSDFLFGGWGLFSDTNIPKPSFHAYKMISFMGSHVLANEQGFLATCDFSGSIQLLFYHYELPNDYYRSNNVSLEDLKSDTEIWDTKQCDTHHVLISNIPDGVYLIKHYALSNTSGNLLSEWKKIDYLLPYRKRDLNDLERLSSLEPTLSTRNVTSNTPLRFSVSLHSNEAVLLTIDLYRKDNHS